MSALEKARTCLAAGKTLTVFSLPLYYFSWNLLARYLSATSRCTRSHKRAEAPLSQAAHSMATSVGTERGALSSPCSPGRAQTLSAGCYSSLPRACSLCLPKCGLSFQQEGLRDPEADLSPAPAAPSCACLALTFPALRPLPFPLDLAGLFLLCLLREMAPRLQL